MKLRAYITHKNAEKYSDCADYFGICPQQKRVAVSDGVSQSIMPLEWAKILVKAFLDKSWDPEQSVSTLQKVWLSEALSYLNEQRSLGKNPWMLENCIANRDGAGATFCGIDFYNKYHWEAKILGDSCLVSISENDEILDIISSKEGDFDNRPDYFDSFKERRGIVKSVKGELKNCQKLLLVSDPFSELFQKFKNSAEASIIIKNILSLKSYDQYLQLVDTYREHYQMHNDDSTLVIIEFDGNEQFSIDKLPTLETLQEQELKIEQETETKKRLEKEEQLWIRAKEINTIDSYKEYLVNSVLKDYKIQAETSIQALISEDEEQKEWDKANSDNSISAYKHYLSNFPNGLHSQEAAIRIEKINNTSSESVHGYGKEEQPEPSSEDSDICRQSKIFTNNHTLPDSILEKNYSGNNSGPTKSGEAKVTESTSSGEATITEPASSGEATITEPTSSAEATITEPASSDEATITEPTSSAEATATEPTSSAEATATESATSTEAVRPRGACNSKKVANKIVANTPDVIIIPSSVDSTDGIDKAEFRELLPTAIALFKKYSPLFKDAFSEPKWRDSPQMYFKKFWFELEEIIFNSHG